jgi:DNA-binding response OmpR family regulator
MSRPARSALVLEDEMIVAIDLERALEELGFAVKIIRTKLEADGWLKANRPDVAILDVILADGAADVLVERLRNLGVPFVVHSGSSPSQHPTLEGGLWFTKPTASAELALAALGLTGRPLS